MKKTMAGLLFLLIMTHCVCPAFAESSPALYRVTDGEGNMLYLLGTVHVGREEMYPLGEAVERAYRAADRLAVEVDEYALLQNPLRFATQYTAVMTYRDGDAVQNHLSPETYALGVRLLPQPEAILNKLRPVAWLTLAEEACYTRIGCSGDWGVDLHLTARAHADGKPVDELEGAEEQLAWMLMLPDEVIEDSLYRQLTGPEEADAEMLALLDAWQRGEAGGLESLLQDAAVSTAPSEAAEQYNRIMYDERNEAFRQKILSYLSGGETVLFAVGAAHVVGEGGLVQRLTEAGCTVEEIGRP